MVDIITLTEITRVSESPDPLDRQTSLCLFGEPYWYSQAGTNNATDIAGCWVDFLAALAQHWSALMLEESLPIPLSIHHPGDLWRKAEQRWENFSEAAIEQEEQLLYEFWHRHNIALWLPGLNLPSLICLRTGQNVWIVDNNNQARSVSLADFRRAMEQIGTQLKTAYHAASASTVVEVLDNWDTRNQRAQRDHIYYRSGLSFEQLARFTTVSGKLVVNEIYGNESPLLAAARMSHRSLNPKIMERFWQLLEHRLMEQQTPVPINADLEQLSREAKIKLGMLQTERPYEQGYQLAKWLRTHLDLTCNAMLDIEALFQQYHIKIDSFNFETDHVSAIACWGQLSPVIFLNDFSKSTVQFSSVKRATLAHEWCHLLVDRETALPVAEVLGGEVDLSTEQRARAFAAELLAPREGIINVIRNKSMENALDKLCNHYKVSRILTALQIKNTGWNLSLEESDRLERIIQDECHSTDPHSAFNLASTL